MLFLSAGHHPAAPGAAWRGLIEHAEAVRWVRELSQFLPTAMVVPPVPLTQKIRWINTRTQPGDLAIEIHFNAATPSVRGSETLYSPGAQRGRAIAADVQAILAKHFTPDRGIKEGWYQQDPSKGRLAFLSSTRCTALILEPEFIYNTDGIRNGMIPCCADLAAFLRRFTT